MSATKKRLESHFVHLLDYLDQDIHDIDEVKKLTHGSKTLINWICPKNPEHKYELNVKGRVRADDTGTSGCPYCSGKKIMRADSFAVVNKRFLKMWHPLKNKGISPFDFSNGSGKKVWWICESKHEWFEDIKSFCRYVIKVF